jgi:hypothetical protein
MASYVMVSKLNVMFMYEFHNKLANEYYVPKP